MDTDQEIYVGDWVEVCEGSWAGRKGIIMSLIDNDYVYVRFSDKHIFKVRACTLTKLPY